MSGNTSILEGISTVLSIAISLDIKLPESGSSLINFFEESLD
ncbi:hypothetical protein ADICYQ_5211 [Cyclobacterium qasimii M12-11B]|uniref:Uncharacterized protein n=1 Tax=Cyclobacterium qasimii M12-11B TaxID=641524 RepID=S7V893_9BACT|nr:hypothetical protein ADICYQ_5211 [Cyclobacterium qasimii M12-11B]